MDYKAEGIKPYDEETDKTTQVREMFDSIAPAYDTMNRTMTLGIDRWWRRVAVKMLRRYSHRRGYGYGRFGVAAGRASASRLCRGYRFVGRHVAHSS